MKTITTSQLFERVSGKELQLVDVRPVEAYNGWKLGSETRGGHIRGARSLPFKWADNMDWIEIVRSKGIVPERPVVVYGQEKEQTLKVASLFERTGHDDVSVYHHFEREWSTNGAMPMDHLPGYRNLVSAAWLKELLDTGEAAEYASDRFVLCHAHYRNPDAYAQGHIPGAIDIDTNSLESAETWNRRSPEELKKTLESKGISSDTTVILYGRFSSPDNDDPFPGSAAGHLGAIRCAFIMMYAGVKDVRVLNGGLQSWQDAGFETTTVETSSKPIDDFGACIPAAPHLAVDTKEAKTILASKGSNLVSVRSWREFTGEVSGYNYIEKKGRIPGAVFGNCGKDAYHMENFRNLDHTTREFHEIEDMLGEVGVVREKTNAFYCGTGWRGSEAWFNVWLMGWPNVSVYDGGWFEWSNDPANPWETGDPADGRA